MVLVVRHEGEQFFFISSRGKEPVFTRNNSRLLRDEDLPSPNPKGSPFRNMAVLTWLDDDGTIVKAYGCRRTFAQFDTAQSLFRHIGRTFNGNDGKHKAKVSNKPKVNPIEAIQQEIDSLQAEVEMWKARARKAERAMDTFRKMFQNN